MEYYEALTREKAFYTLRRKNLQDILLTKEDKVKSMCVIIQLLYYPAEIPQFFSPHENHLQKF